MKWVKSFENIDLGKGWPVEMVSVDFTGGDDGVYALYINDELHFYGDYYHDKIEIKIKSFVQGAKWSGKNIHFYEFAVQDRELIDEVSTHGNTPPKNLNSFYKVNELFGIGNIIRKHKYSGEMDASEVYYSLSKTPKEFHSFEYSDRVDGKNLIKSYAFKNKLDSIKVEMICYIPGIITPGTTEFDLYINDIKLECSRRTSSGIYNMVKRLFRKSQRD